MIELSEQERKAVREGEALLLHPKDLGHDVYVLRAEVYQELIELLQNEKEKAAWAKVGLQSAARWAAHNEF